MTKDEIIASLEDQAQDKDRLAEGNPDSIFTHDAKALQAAADVLRPQLDRSQWEGCETCNNTPGIMFGVITMAIGKRFLSTDEHDLRYCPECGRPLTEEAWAEMERRIFGNDG